jgi:uncharacterized hydrophobic protein (TIGR00271 family)
VLRLRIIVPGDLTTAVVEGLRDAPGVAHLVHVPGAAAVPPGDLVTCDVAREAADEIIEWLQDHGVHRRGAITAEPLGTVVSDAAAAAEARAAGEGADALVWEEIEARVRSESVLSASFLVFLAVAAVLAAVGILLDSPILIVGAMVVGPEYGPLAACCVAAVRGRPAGAATALRTLTVGLAVGALAALVATALFRVTGLAPDDHRLAARELTAFIAHPDGLAAVVAVLAGVVGMLSLTEARSGALIGVLVSVTTIPAVGNVGVATAYGHEGDVGGAALQLAINLAGLVVAGVATLAAQARWTGRRARSTRVHRA